MKKNKKNRPPRRKSKKNTRRPLHSEKSVATPDHTGDAASIDREFSRAIEHLRKGHHAKTEELLQKILRRQPKNSDALHLLGVACCQQADETKQLKGLRALKKAAELEPGDDEIRCMIGVACNNLKRPEEAIANFQRALEINPGNVETNKFLGITLTNSGQYIEAVRNLNSVLSASPNDTEVHANLGIALDALQRHEEAISHFSRAIELDPNNVELASNLGFAQEAIGLFDKAAETWLQALEKCESLNHESRIALQLSRLPKKSFDVDLLPIIDRLRNGAAPNPQTEIEKNIDRKLSLARAYQLDKQKRFDEAWDLLVSVNREIDELYDSEYKNSLDNYKKALNRALDFSTRTRRSPIAENEVPISLFILGPSRAGKSTLERLLGTAKGVQKGYENGILNIAADRAAHEVGQEPVSNLSDLGGEINPRFNDLYFREIEAVFGRPEILTNTRPGIINSAGWIAEHLPRVRFVFVRRREDDNALQIFWKRYATDSNYYAYDVKKIYDYIARYNRLIDVWMERLSDISILVSYEDIIARPQKTLAGISKLCERELQFGPFTPPSGDIGCAEPYAAHLKKALGAL